VQPEDGAKSMIREVIVASAILAKFQEEVGIFLNMDVSLGDHIAYNG
jgi:hypothetical protein